jgi:glycosyltransferase involved in cell wall biosynthesis
MSDSTAPQPAPRAAARRPLAPNGTAPAVSLVMPVRNEERHLAEAVRAVLSQDYPGDLELVLAVGPSHDRTDEISKRIAAADSRVTVVPNPSGLIPSAVNAAIKASRYSVVARVDGHCVLPPGYLRTAVQALEETGADNAGGVMAAAGVTPFEQAVAWAMTSPAGVGASPFHTGGEPGPADTVYLGVYRRAAIEQVGGYNEAYQVAEDWEMNHRIRLAGGLIWFLPDLQVTYRPRADVRALGLQYFRYGRWRRVVARQHAGTINRRYLAPPAAALAVAAGTLAGLAGLAGLAAGHAGSWPLIGTAGFAVPLLYLAGLLAVTSRAARSLPGRVTIRLPVVMAVMHMCWGAGFLTSPASLVPGNGRRNR